MKSLPTIILTCVFWFSAAAQEAPPCPPTGVTTNPENPINTIEPSALHQMHQNDFFDWTTLEYEAQLGQFFPKGIMINPNNDPNGATRHLGLEPDYLPEDGWELLYVDLGLDREGNWNPQSSAGDLFVILYNKYRGIVRVFVAIVAAGENSLVEMELSMNGGNNTALLASIDKVQQPLLHYDATNIASNTQVFSNNATDSPNWFYADFPVNYDPCTCEDNQITTPSMFVFKAKLLSEGRIELNGVSTGSLKIDKQPSANAQSNWDKFYGTAEKVGKSVKAGRKGFKDFDVFKDDVKKSAEGKDKESDMESGIDNLGNFLTDEIPVLKAVPYASEALALIDFFVGGGKKEGPQEVTFPPMSMQLEHSFTGSLIFSSNYINRAFYTPGSSFTPQNTNAQGEPFPNGDPHYPVYNEILGVYTLLDKPKVTMWKGFSKQTSIIFWNNGRPRKELSERIIRRGFIVDPESIKIAVNEASNLTLKEAYLQLIYTKEGANEFIEGQEGSEVEDSLWVSPLVPVACADDRFLATEIKQNLYPYYSTVEHEDIGVDISLVLTFESNDGNRFLHKATWACDVEEKEYSYEHDRLEEHYGDENKEVLHWDWFDKPEFNNLNTGFFNVSNHLPLRRQMVDEDAIAAETIVVKNSTIEATPQALANNGITQLTAGQNIVVLHNSEIKPNADLHISSLGMDCKKPITLASAEEIGNICQSTEYLAEKIVGKKIPQGRDSQVQEQLRFSTYPNPADELIKITVTTNLKKIAHFNVNIRDMAGRSMIRARKKLNAKGVMEIETSNLAPGIYLLQLRGGNFRAMKKFTVE